MRWLADARGAGVVEVVEVAEDHLDLRHLTNAPATPEHADALGRALARTHAAGAPAYGSGPDGWAGHGWLGPAGQPLPLPLEPTRRWGEFFAEQRVRHTLRLAVDRGLWTDAAERALFERVATRVENGEFDDTTSAPARLHGDLWSGNVFWTESGAVLIDPAAHGGHAEADLAMLALFGASHLPRIIAAYAEVAPLADGWKERLGLHQLHPVLLHAVLFGGGYVEQAMTLARRFA